MNKTKVAILGATGSVGQKFIELLADHPWFEIAELAASKRSAGKKYSEAVSWVMQTPLPQRISEMEILECTTEIQSKLVFSALDSSVAGEIETEFAKAGKYVISNARNHRFDPDVPLVIPEVNADHLELIKQQKFESGVIVTNPNCSTIGLVMALKPIHDNFGIEKLNVVTMQAISGAGYPGLSAFDINDNVVPLISGEEDKLETEPLKILGKIEATGIVEEKIQISAQCNRVPVLEGHLECVQLELRDKASKEELISAWENFRSDAQHLSLPSAPVQPIHYFSESNLPQPKTQRNLENGMAVSVGRLRKDSLLDYKFVVLSHNTVRGAAGGTILIAELMKAKNMLSGI